MRIYAALLTEAPNLWHYELADSLKKIGHEVLLPQGIGMNESWGLAEKGRWASRHRHVLSQRLLRDVRRVHKLSGIDLFFAYAFPFQFDPQTFKQIETLGIPTVFLYCDNLTDDEAARTFSRFFTLTWVPEKAAVPLYEQLKARFIYLPLAANPDFDRPLERREFREIVCVATKTPYRRRLLGELLKRNYALEVYGNHWRSTEQKPYYGLDIKLQENLFDRLTWVDHCFQFLENRKKSLKAFFRYGFRPKRMWKKVRRWGEECEPFFQNKTWGYPVSGQRMVELFSEAKVTLGINHYIDAGFRNLEGLTFSKMRDFQALMSGACYLTQATPELDDFYTESDCFMTYHSIEELCEKADWLLKNDSYRQKTRENARRYSLAHHTWAHRFEVLFKKLGLAEKRSTVLVPGFAGGDS